MNEPVTKARKKTLLLRMWGYLFRYKFLLVLALFLTLGGNLLNLLGPKLSGMAIDAIGIGGGDVQMPKVLRYCVQMILCYAVSALMSYFLGIVMLKLSQKTVYQMRKDVFDRLTELPVSFFDRNQAGEILSRMQYDVNTVNESLSNDLLQIVTSLVTVVGSLVMMLSIAPVLVLTFAVTIPVTVLFTRYKTRKVRPLFRKRSAKMGEMNGYAEEILSGQKTVKAYHREKVMEERYEKKNHESAEAYYTAEYYGSMFGPTVNLINNVSLSLVSVFGAVLFLFGKISIGNISSFVLYSRKFAGPINEFANIMNEMQSAISAAERVFRIIDEPPETPDLPDARELPAPQGNVEMRHVSFGYTQDKTVLSDLSFSAEKGKTIAVVGKTGSGKTTIINLLMRFYDPQEGEILLDGVPTLQLKKKSMRQAYSMVLQETWLFRGTVAENLAYARPGASREEIEAAAKAARIHTFITGLPQGYDTVLADNGVQISYGQKQLMTIARAFLSDARILILDEATSNVDTRTEALVQQAMTDLMRGRTCFIIAHRLSTVQNADRILVLENGKIAEQGTHEELLSFGGRYASLYASQFE